MCRATRHRVGRSGGDARAGPARHAHVHRGQCRRGGLARDTGAIRDNGAAAHGRLVVWPLLAATSDCSAGYQRALLGANDELRAATRRWTNLALLDYPAFLAPHPEYSEHRCPHLLPAGYAATATWLASEV